MPNWLTYDSLEALEIAALETIKSCAQSAIADHGFFSIVLAGGTTPKSLYTQLAQDKKLFEKWVLYYGDERCLPRDDPERNSQMVKQTGLSKRVAKEFIMPAELGAEQGARLYKDTISNAMPFDLVLLGMGEDGHTASLFPERLWQNESVIAVVNSPKPPAERVSLSIESLQNTHHMMAFAFGETKQQALSQWKKGEDLPIKKVTDIPQADILTLK